jgi:hypothetical protein
MTAGVYHFTIEQGSTFTRVITYKDSGGTAIDLTGYTARMHLRRRIEDSDSLIELTSANGRIALGGIAGTITLTISATDSANLSPVEGVYDLELASSGGTVEKLLKGTFTIEREVTR